MKILHFYDPDKDIQARYVHLLKDVMGGRAELHESISLRDARQQLAATHFDLLHLHGCWSQRYAAVASTARQGSTRVVITPHGELEPWVLKEREWQEKLPKTLLYQRRTIMQACVIIAMGKMEAECLRRLGWNPRVETVRNALITHSVSSDEMTRQLFTIYRRVMDSDPLSLMAEAEREVLFMLLKAGTCGSKEWTPDVPDAVRQLDTARWRRLFLYARDEQVEGVLRRGLRVLNIATPDIDVSTVEHYLPTGYEPPVSIASAIGNHHATENDRLLATFRHLQKLVQHNQLAVCHLLELEKEIREHYIDESALAETLKEHRLLPLARHIMGVMQRLTNFEEGLMPVTPLDDKKTANLEQMITKHLSI